MMLQSNVMEEGRRFNGYSLGGRCHMIIICFKVVGNGELDKMVFEFDHETEKASTISNNIIYHSLGNTMVQK